MTNEDAIKILRTYAISSGVKQVKNAVFIAVNAIKKQIPKKIEIWNGQCACPNCNKLFGSYAQLKTLIHWEMPYCKFCGQALDWSDNE